MRLWQDMSGYSPVLYAVEVGLLILEDISYGKINGSFLCRSMCLRRVVV